jgi:hypothetical protein
VPSEWGRAISDELRSLGFQKQLVTELFESVLDIENRKCASETVRDEVWDKARIYLTSLAMTMKDSSCRLEDEWRLLKIQNKDAGRFAVHTRSTGVSYFDLPIVKAGLVSEVRRRTDVYNRHGGASVSAGCRGPCRG